MKADPLKRVREICLALPESTEKITWETPTFRVRDKIFAMFTNDHHGDQRIALLLKAPPGVQEIVVGSSPERFFVPRYVGHKGWIGLRLDVDVDWGEVAAFVEESYQMTAPKPRAAAKAKRSAHGAIKRRSKTG